MSKPPRAKYRTTNWSEYNAALKRRGSLMVWLDADLQWKAPASGRSGRPAVFSDAAIQFCLTLKCMFGLGLRQATGLAESLIKLAHLDWAVPDYSTLSRRQKTLSVAIATRRSSAGLHLLIDSTGVKMLGEGEWTTKKHGADYRRQWRKVHLGIDAQTLEIRAIEITDNAIGDAPMTPSRRLPALSRHCGASAPPRQMSCMGKRSYSFPPPRSGRLHQASSARRSHATPTSGGAALSGQRGATAELPVRGAPRARHQGGGRCDIRRHRSPVSASQALRSRKAN